MEPLASNGKCGPALGFKALSHVKDGGSNPPVQPLPQLLWRRPNDMVLVVRVEVELANLIFPAAPNHRAAQPHCETGFVVHSGPLSGEVRHHELTVANLGHDLVGDLVIVFLLVYANQRETRFLDCRFDTAFVCSASLV